MRFRLYDRASSIRPELLFEELEQRIVMDASVDSAGPDAHVDGSCLFHGLMPGMDEAVAPGYRDRQNHSSDNWSLEYSSEPSVRMDEVIDHGVLAGADVELGTPVPGIVLYAVPPTRDSQTTVDLSGAVRITGDTTELMQLAITFNPRPLTSNGIAALSFAETTVLDVTIDPPGSDVLANTWTFEGHADSLNAILATMQATLNSCFTGTAEIDITLTDPDHTTNSDDAPLIDKTLYIPVDRPPYPPTLTVPNPVTATSNVWTPAPVSVQDVDSNDVGIILRVDHGIISVPTNGCNIEGLELPPVTYVGTDGPTGTPLSQGPQVGIRGPLPNLQCVLGLVNYQSYPGYHGRDTLTVTANDGCFTPKVPCCNGNIISVTPIWVP